MNRIPVSVAALAATCISSSVGAQATDCPFGPNWPTTGVYALQMERPEIGETLIIANAEPVDEKTVLARQVVRLRPKVRYLSTDAVLASPDAEKLGQAVPLRKGALVTNWRKGDETRDCSIGWKNGLFGGATGDGHYRWICFADRDGDGAYDAVFRTQTKNMGLSYSQLDIPLASPVRVSASNSLADNPADETAALGTHELEQTLVVRKVKKDHVRLRLEGVTRRDRVEVELPSVPGRSVTLGGFTVTVVSVDGKNVVLKTIGRFEDPEVVPVCGGTYYSVDGLAAQVSFTFPNW